MNILQAMHASISTEELKTLGVHMALECIWLYGDAVFMVVL